MPSETPEAKLNDTKFCGIVIVSFVEPWYQRFSESISVITAFCIVGRICVYWKHAVRRMGLLGPERRDEEMKVEVKRYFSVLLMIIFFLGVGCFHLSQKSGYYVDEGMTFFLANGQYNGAITTKTDFGFRDFLADYVWKDDIISTLKNIWDMLREVFYAGNYSTKGTVEWYDAARNMLQGESTWISGKELEEQIRVTEHTRFQYAQVYLNQMLDVHPPLYYLVVHTVCSVFYKAPLNWCLFGVNIFCLLLSCVVLYCVINEMGNQQAAWLAVLIYGSSQGFYSSAMYFRMYAMLTLFVLLTVWIHVHLEKKEWNMKRRDRVILCTDVLLGFMTHYYFILFLIPLLGITACKTLLKRLYDRFWIYFKTMLTAGMISLVIWPFSIYHIIFGYRGTEARENLNFIGWGNRLEEGKSVIEHAMFLDSRIFFFFGIGLATVYWLLNRKTERGGRLLVGNYSSNGGVWRDCC